MKNTIYQDVKSKLKAYNKEIITLCNNDKPMQRMALNDYTDQLMREIEEEFSHENISYKQCKYFIYLLENYCCKLHLK